MDHTILQISQLNGATKKTLFNLNNEHAEETSFLAPDKFRVMVEAAFSATAIGGGAFLITFDQAADYDSENFLWFRERFDRFVYVDRIIVSEQLRGIGAARSLYLDLFERAVAAQHDRIVCEINRIPPNPGSDAFHEKMGFEEVGRAELTGNGKTVRYLVKRLPA